MPRFYFDFDEGDAHGTDDQGTEFPDLQSACSAAVTTLPSIAQDARPRIEGLRELTVTVRDEAGKPVYRAILTIAGQRINGRAVEARKV